MSAEAMRAADDVVIMEQWAAGEGGDGPGSGVSVVPPLAEETLAALECGERAAAGVRLEVPGIVGLLTIRADPARTALAHALEGAFGLALAERLSSVAREGLRLRWMSPDEWLLSCAAPAATDLERRLRAALGEGATENENGARGGPFAITNVTGGWCVFTLGGPAALDVLAKSTSLDVDPRVFPPGRVASTLFAKTVATLGNLGEGRYEIICRRSFADYVARWIATAAREPGLALERADEEGA